MFCMIIYLLGVAAALFFVVDVFRSTSYKWWGKALLSLAMVLFSWIGVGVYYYIIRA